MTAQVPCDDSEIPVPDKVLRDLAKNVAKILPNFDEEEPATGVKKLRGILSPVLETADLPELENSHRAAASNALCAIIEHCAASKCQYAQEEILSDFIWMRTFNIYLQRSGDAKGKSMRQMLLVLTGVVTKDQNPRAIELRKQATACFLDIICEREDRIKVKPALQGLAHFLLKEVISIPELVSLFDEQLKHSSGATKDVVNTQTVFLSFLAWVVHHDTSLSAGHLIKNFLTQARRLPDYWKAEASHEELPLWVDPVVRTLRDWPDRIQEFKTHVFPHCFLPNISEYTCFLAYLRFGSHVPHKGALPEQLSWNSGLQTPFDSTEEFRILLAAIATGKELTIVKDNDHRVNSSIEIRDDAVYLPDDVAGKWMSDPEPEVRLAGMFLSVYSTSVTKVVSGGVLQALKRNLIHLHTETDSNFRREVHGYTQKLFDRLRASTATLSKGMLKGGAASQARLPFPKAAFDLGLSHSKSKQQDSLLESLSFIVWYKRFLQWELRPTASYQSRITALRSFIIVLRSGIDPGVPFNSLSKSAQGQLNWAHELRIGNMKLFRLLLDLILDPFDDVRDAAVAVLQLCLGALPQTEKERVMSIIPPFIARAEAIMLLTGRADQADGVARAYGMVFASASKETASSTTDQFSSKLAIFEHLQSQLKNTLDIAHTDLSQAVDGRPVHGIFAALRYVVDQPDFYALVSGVPPEAFAQWKRLHGDVVESIESLWNCVYHVLCADAPEGHVPDEMEDEGSLDTKEILSYSWRGLKEASVLLRTVISKAPVGDKATDLMSPQLFEKLGRLCFTQLLELRHRGAFSTVSQTFAVFCRRCVTSSIVSLRALPEAWYQETLSSIQAKSDAITRRSAGIPAAMSALLAAEPQSSGKLFPRAMKDLTAETLVQAQSANIEESRLPQVHALNCIKEIFTTSKLSVASEAYIGQGLELAAKTLNSPIWPLRNCSLMLFKALIERLLGSDEAQDWKERDRAKTSRFSYDNYPSLVNILLDLLDPNGNRGIMDAPESGSSPLDLHGAEGVFPALQILRQARPPGDISKIQSLVRNLLPSPHWHMRDMAARTYVSLCSVNEGFGALGPILDNLPESHNAQHGRLLVTKYFLRKILRDPTQFTLHRFATMMQQICRHAPTWYVSSNCLFVRAAFLDIVSLCGMTMLRQTGAVSIMYAWNDLAASVFVGPEYSMGPSDHHGDDLYRNSLAQVFFVDRVIMRDDSLGVMVSNEYQCIGSALMLLATEDPDTCMAALDTLDAIIQSKPTHDLTVPLSLVLAHIHRVVLEASDAEVISKAQSVLASALTNRDLHADFFTLTTDDQTFLSLKKLEEQCLGAPPSNMQSGLHLLGFFLDHAYASLPHQRARILPAIARYIRLLRQTILDTNPFDTRFAAIQSLNALRHIFTARASSAATGPLILSLSLILYDLLHDDDDEIRDVAAATTGGFLRAQRVVYKDTVPILTSHHLLLHLSRAFTHSPHLVVEAVRRSTSTTAASTTTKDALGTPFAQTLAQERKLDTALFAQEKQNLYKDNVLDTLLWSRLLLLLPSPPPAPVSAATSSPTHHSGIPPALSQWVLTALDTLTQTAGEEDDGALGWSSKAERKIMYKGRM
ncbi:heat repeat-containing protein [Stemphylium lycopersici]|nr:heat repeat-containing protein [Stemphylium lycopersici]